MIWDPSFILCLQIWGQHDQGQLRIWRSRFWPFLHLFAIGLEKYNLEQSQPVVTLSKPEVAVFPAFFMQKYLDTIIFNPHKPIISDRIRSSRLLILNQWLWDRKWHDLNRNKFIISIISGNGSSYVHRNHIYLGSLWRSIWFDACSNS